MRRFAGAAALVITLLTANAIPQERANRVTIEGIVTRRDSGQPIAGALLMISRWTTNAQGNLVRIDIAPRPPRGTDTAAAALLPQANVVTDINGRFVFASLEPGMYHVVASANGYVRQGFGQRSIAAVSWGTLIDLTSGGSMKNAAIQLTASGVVRGRIVDEAGQPAVRVPVQLLQFPYDASGAKTLRRIGAANTDDRGEYRISEITPGRYFVAIGTGAGPVPSGRQAPSVLYAYQYFPGVRDAAQAAAVVVQSDGEAIADMKASRLELRTVRGRVIDLTGTLSAKPLVRGSPLVSISFSFAWDSTNNIDSCGCFDTGSSFDLATGKFEIRNVIPGAYTAQARTPDTNSRTNAERTGILGFNERVIRTNVAPIVVGDSDVEDVILTFNNPVAISGRLTVEGRDSATVPEGIRVLFRSSTIGVPDIIRHVEGATVDATGTFRVPDVPIGEYLTSVIVPPALYVKSVQWDTRDLLRNPLEFSGAAGASMEIVLGSDGGQVSGIVTDAMKNPVAGVQAVIIPEKKPNRPELYKNMETDPNGRFRFIGVAPGDYRVFAWDGMSPYRYFDPGFLGTYAAQGKSIHVGEAASVTADVQSITIPQD
jgi:protocatechuate 3,4-dioxygenase beta subunit